MRNGQLIRVDFNTLFSAFFLLFFATRTVVVRRLYGLDLALVGLLAIFFVWPDGLLSSGLKLCYLVLFFVFGAFRRIPSSMAVFAVAYIGVYCASLVQTDLPMPAAFGLLAGSSIVVFLVQRGGAFFDIRAKQFRCVGREAGVFTHFAHLEYLIFRAFPVLLILYALVPFLRYRFHL